MILFTKAITFFSKYSKLLKFGGVGFLALGLLWAAWDYGQTRQAYQELQTQRTQLLHTIDVMKTNLNRQKEQLNEMRRQQEQIEQDYRHAIDIISNLRGQTTDEVIENRLEVETQINELQRDYNRRLRCLTGVQEAC